MSRGPNPNFRTRRLGRRLREVRRSVGLTAQQVASEVACSPSRISRIESGEIRVRPGDVHELLDVYQPDEGVRQALIAMARDVRHEEWWDRYNDVLSRRHLTFVALEAEAASMRNFELSVIPGLLQTEDYARAVVRVVREDATEEIDRRVMVRMARQKVLTKERPLDLHVVLDEAALHRRMGGDAVMRDQLSHLVELAQLPNVTVEVLPFASGAHPSIAGSFAILTFPDAADRQVAYTETRMGDQVVERDDEVRHLVVTFEQLRARTMSHEDSVSFITQMVHSI
ncbi:MAG TPA: helix-turn-helix transcriptional regulator [Mycobacteriales bacterium]